MSRLRILGILALALFATTPSVGAADDSPRAADGTKTRPKPVRPKPRPPPKLPPRPQPVSPRAAAVPHPAPSSSTHTPIKPRETAPKARPAHLPPPRGPVIERPVAPRIAHREGIVDGWRTTDPRFARPDPHYVQRSSFAPHAPPRWDSYRAWYTHWYVHPWWRWTHATVVFADLDHDCQPWVDIWIPSPRPAFSWVRGHWDGSYWVPGHWVPLFGPAAWPDYVWVAGWWLGNRYVEGYWRMDRRPGWAWVHGAYYNDDSYAWGYWMPLDAPPDGYVWEPGFWDGLVWVEGFWRPIERKGYGWVAATYGADGVFRAGYWEPLEARPDKLWVPGWFDGESWIEGYWADRDDPEGDITRYAPEDGYDDGWAVRHPNGDSKPVAIPATR